MVINDALHPRMLELLRVFKGQVFNPQVASSSSRQQEHRKVSGEYGRIWMKEKGPKLFAWLVGGPAIWGSFLIWAAATDSIASKAALAAATVLGVGALVASVIRDRSKLTIEGLECFLPALECLPIERLYLETFLTLYRSKAVDDKQRTEVAKLLNDLLDLEYVLADHDETLGMFSVEAIEKQLDKVSKLEGNEEIQRDMQERLEQARSEQPLREQFALARIQIESSLIGLRHDLARSNHLTSASLDPLIRAKELLDQVRAASDARAELDRFVEEHEADVQPVELIQTTEEPSADLQQKGSAG